ncbi:MAG: DUF1330 domain-containing protein [Hyphomicrobiaceae bacterium]
MPTVAEKITIASPPEEVWPLLSDPALVASCIPGATLAPDQSGGDVWKGQIRVKFGPTVALFRGEATLAYDHDNRRCTIEGRGIDGRGASRALAHGVVSAAGTTETQLSVEGEYSVTGPLETFANAGGVHVARALLAEFAKNMGALVMERRHGAAAAPSEAIGQEVVPAATPAPAAPSSPALPATSAPSVAEPPAARPAAEAASTPAAKVAAATADWNPAAAVYVVSDVEVKDQAAFERYRSLARESVEAFGGRYVVRGGGVRPLEGDWSPQSLVVIEFPSRAAAERWYGSEAYRKALAHKDSALSRKLLMVEGLPVARPAAASTAAPPPRAAAAELNASTLLWAAFKSWLSGLFGKRS